MPKAARQPYLHDSLKPRTEHGGEIRTGKRKLSRPIGPKRPIHLVLRSEVAKGRLSLFSQARAIESLTHALARRYRVRVHRYANGGNHLHLVIQVPSRKAFQAFLKLLSGRVAQRITGARKGVPFGKFWEKLAYTKLLHWGRHFRNAFEYVIINEMEAQQVPSGRKVKSVRAGPRGQLRVV